jgi:hypothetical protein
MLRGMRRRQWILLAGGLALASLVVGGLMIVRRAPPVTLDIPRAGEARADYLPDGSPVWVIGHEDGSVDVFSAISTHVASGLAKLTWWCPKSRSLEDPFHGSIWSEFGVKTYGPAPYDLTRWTATVQGAKVLLGDEKTGVRSGGGVPQERPCTTADDVTFHTFKDWHEWNSPSELLAAHPDGWALLAGGLASPSDGSVMMCSVGGCDDAVVLDGVGRGAMLGRFPDELFILKVRDGKITNPTRVIVPEG